MSGVRTLWSKCTFSSLLVGFLVFIEPEADPMKNCTDSGLGFFLFLIPILTMLITTPLIIYKTQRNTSKLSNRYKKGPKSTEKRFLNSKGAKRVVNSSFEMKDKITSSPVSSKGQDRMSQSTELQSSRIKEECCVVDTNVDVDLCRDGYSK